MGNPSNGRILQSEADNGAPKNNEVQAVKAPLCCERCDLIKHLEYTTIKGVANKWLCVECSSHLKTADAPRVDGVQVVIEERENTHGNYLGQAETAQALKGVIASALEVSGVKLRNYHRETLEMIAVKMSRILHGNPDEPDHYRDIAGYATLSLNIITKGTHL